MSAPGKPLTELVETQPLPVSSTGIIRIGIALWAVALALTLALPSLHVGDRSWWPWTCVSGIILGVVGYAYVRRGRGNAADADH
ncbi:MAG: DUF2530 domain-containing protein [Nostocoides sp.]